MKQTPLKSKTGLKAKQGLKPGSGLNARSKKRATMYKEQRVPMVIRLLAEVPWCEACPIYAKHDMRRGWMQRPSEHVHEILSRGAAGSTFESLLDRDNVLMVCSQCHSRIGDKPKEAIELGLSKSTYWRTDGSDTRTDDRGGGG